MILQIERLPIEQPKISLNQLGEFPFASPAKKMSILRGQKYGNPFGAPYYTRAEKAIIRCLKDGTFSEDLLISEKEKIASVEPRSRYWISNLRNNFNAIQSFTEIGLSANPTTGIHRIIRANARVRIDGVIVSARPEIITENQKLGEFSFTKLRFSKSKVSADASEISLLALLHYAQQQSYPGLTFCMEKSKLIDCFSKSVIEGHTVGRHRYQQLHRALSEIRGMWPYVQGLSRMHNNYVG